MPYLYVTEQGAYIRKKGPHIVVVKDGEDLADYAAKDIQCLIVFGGIQVTSDAMLALLDQGCDVAFMTQNGHFKGRLVSAAGKNSILREKQYRYISDPVRCCAIAKKYVTAKIKNGMAVLDDYHSSGHNAFIFHERAELASVCDSIAEKCDSMGSLRGYEGTAARLYFGGFARCLLHGRVFPGRKFHPSTDPVNALLSFGYSFIARELQAVCDALGLDPYMGFFHDVTYGRASLSLDLMEEFRHPLVDRLVLKLFNKKILDDNDFETGTEGQVYLKKESLKVFIRQYEEWANENNRTWTGDKELSWRKAMWSQGEALRRAIEDDTEYKPFSWGEI